ncbi:hypothetical protein SAMN05421688_1426 [Poseidonocella pacifica]|uniref:ChaC-like protein n=1 Tax=Poseidonocella pacifica TaxID=871651 RepID=A0A1I0WH31_9RHOB|nr:gamma-glutamylcyclotransferase family protein [Poseidonocella pacifica]SFA87951.1 hypothetical protein SAMN05421688_1426 [Poseidonocella pacifica]
MNHPFFFGYGSLVNRATHDYPSATPASVAGWRRVWRHTGLRPVAFLSVEPCATTEISGLIAQVPGGDWAALDAREAAYDRLDATHQVRHDLPAPAPVAIYSVARAHRARTEDRHPILLSYLDVVVQGFAREHGEAGVADFFATTDGWDGPVYDDRENPLYPRHQILSAEERALVDEHLTRRKVLIIDEAPALMRSVQPLPAP